ncbi:MAG: fumarate hydratase [Spirochaetia bacterium]|nr:fumarate hydratase [Spirochaetia bacterium]
MSHMDLSRYLDFGRDDEYRKLDLPPPEPRNGRLCIDAGALAELSRVAFSEIAFKYPKGHLEGLAAMLADERSSQEERFVIETLLRNAAVAAEGLFPICQDTGTALIYGWKGEKLGCATAAESTAASPGGREGWRQEDAGESISASTSDMAALLAEGAGMAYAEHRLRASQLGPLNALAERNTKDNLPALVDIRAVPGDSLRLLFAAKGGGSTSRTSLAMESPALLRDAALKTQLEARIKGLGVAGCPPYTIAAILGGASASQTLYALELASYGLLDGLPAEAAGDGKPVRSLEWEKTMAEIAAQTGLGAQWGGRQLALDTRFIRLSRHAATLPFALGISCSAHRKARAFIDSRGWFIEKMEEDPARLLPKSVNLLSGAVEIDFDAPKELWLEKLRSLKAGTPLLLSGRVCLARDAAHARIAAGIREGAGAPKYMIDHPVFYAGPTDPAPGKVTGSFGPTTASRMDPYIEEFTQTGASLVSIAKGGRGAAAIKALAASRGAYIACIGGAAALTARDHVLESKLIDHADLGMEAVRLVRLSNLPAILVIDSTGGNFYA